MGMLTGRTRNLAAQTVNTAFLFLNSIKGGRKSEVTAYSSLYAIYKKIITSVFIGRKNWVEREIPAAFM